MKPADETKPSKPQASSTNPKVLMALGRAFTEAGEKHELDHFKEVGRNLIIKAREGRFGETPTPVDQWKAGTTKDSEIKSSPVESEASGSKITAGTGISGFRLADAVPLALVVPILLWALLPDNPYAYYRLLRWVCCPCFAYLAVEAYRRNLDGWVWVLGVTALIYNPVIPVHLNKSLWIVINVVSIALAIAGTWAIRQSGKRRAITGERANYE